MGKANRSKRYLNSILNDRDRAVLRLKLARQEIDLLWQSLARETEVNRRLAEGLEKMTVIAERFAGKKGK